MMLKPAQRERAALAPQSWQQLPHGEWLQEQLGAALAASCAKVFGYYLARVGHLAKELDLPNLRVQHQFSAAAQGAVDVRTQLEYWPFGEAALDAILMVGQLEFERDPHQVLREMSRSLIADGHLIIAGFNPLSPAVLTGLWPNNTKRVPWSGRYFSKARISDWLALLNFEVIASGYVGATMMWSGTARPDLGLARASRMVPQLSSMYYIVARKREFPLTVVRVRKRVKARVNSLPVANRVK